MITKEQRYVHSKKVKARRGETNHSEMQASVFFGKTASRKGSLEPRIVKRLAQGELGTVASVESRPSTR